MATVRSTKLSNMRDKSWYSITNKADGPTQVHIYDEIGYVGVSAQQFMADIAAIKGPIEVHLNTPGGEVFDGIAIYNCLKQRGDVPVYVDSLAASIGSVIAQAGNPTVMAKNSQMMIHDGFGMTIGNAADMREMADVLDRTSDNIASIYADKTGQPSAKWRDVMRNETWFTAQEAVDAGLADYVQGDGPVKMQWDLSIYNTGNAGWVQRDGKWVFDPDNDGDDDSTAAGDEDHDYWDADGNQLKSIPPNPATGKGGKPLPPKQKKSKGNKAEKKVFNAKYKQDDRDRMAKSGEAMPDGSFPVADEEDLNNAVHAVGRSNNDHDDVRQHIIKRAKALGKPDAIRGLLCVKCNTAIGLLQDDPNIVMTAASYLLTVETASSALKEA